MMQSGAVKFFEKVRWEWTKV